MILRFLKFIYTTVLYNIMTMTTFMEIYPDNVKFIRDAAKQYDVQDYEALNVMLDCIRRFDPPVDPLLYLTQTFREDKN